MARTFNGSTDWLDGSTTPTIATDNWTICSWAKPRINNSVLCSICVGHDAGGNGSGYNIVFHNDSKVHGFLGFVADVDSNVTYSTGTWCHALFTRSGGTSKVYVNGDGSASSTSGSGPNTPSDNYAIGVEPNLAGVDTDRWFDGELAEAAVWEAALTQAEITALAKGFSPALIRPDSLVSYVPIIGRADPEIDLVRSQTLAVDTLNGVPKAEHPYIINPQGSF